MRLTTLCLLLSIIVSHSVTAQEKVDAGTKLYLSQADYKTPYGPTTPDAVKEVIDRVYTFIDQSTPMGVIDTKTQDPITDYSQIDKNSGLEKGIFSLTNYTWGVTYSAMLQAYEITGDERYKAYVSDRFQFLTEVSPYFEAHLPESDEEADPQLRQLLRPKALDDAGAIYTSMIKAQLADVPFDGKAIMDRYWDFIYYKEHRLADGTFARNRPQRNTLWLDDMFMGIPSLAYHGRLTGDHSYYDEAIQQVMQFAERMFLPEKGLYRHGWVEEMNPHPNFHWGRANGWALMTKVEVLDAIPEGYPGREKVLDLLKAHIAGLTALQSGDGFWHQLLDRNDSYYETSCTAIYAYCMAHAINEGWIDPLAYGSQTMLAWHAVTTQVNNAGEVEGTCVGTGMGYDPAFYYYRPINKYAGHGYGPVILAGAEIYRLLKNENVKMNDSALLFYREAVDTDEPIFYLESKDE